MNTISDELLPCPFCGSPGELDRVHGFLDGFSWQVACSKTGANGAPDCVAFGRGYESKGEAIAAWNNRADAIRSQRAQAGRSDLVPGVVACAKCKFRLVRNVLHVQSGAVSAGDSATEPCPNGCGPLWPVTWESDARESMELCERLHIERNELTAEVDRLNAIINTPQADDFLRAVSTEAEHQRQRWGSNHDAGKTAADWFWLVGYLAGKALHSINAGDTVKGEHHVITTAAALANWHIAIKGRTNMRPGIDGAAVLAGTPEPQSAQG